MRGWGMPHTLEVRQHTTSGSAGERRRAAVGVAVLRTAVQCCRQVNEVRERSGLAPLLHGCTQVNTTAECVGLVTKRYRLQTFQALDSSPLCCTRSF